MTPSGVTESVVEDIAMFWLKRSPRPLVYLEPLRTDWRHMTHQPAKPNCSWTVAAAKARLSEILRLAKEECPQRIGVRRAFVVVPAAVWDAKTQPRKPLGQWLVENVPRATNLEIPHDRGSERKIPFIDEEDA